MLFLQASSMQEEEQANSKQAEKTNTNSSNWQPASKQQAANSKRQLQSGMGNWHVYGGAQEKVQRQWGRADYCWRCFRPESAGVTASFESPISKMVACGLKNRIIACSCGSKVGMRLAHIMVMVVRAPKTVVAKSSTVRLVTSTTRVPIMVGVPNMVKVQGTRVRRYLGVGGRDLD